MTSCAISHPVTQLKMGPWSPAVNEAQKKGLHTDTCQLAWDVAGAEHNPGSGIMSGRRAAQAAHAGLRQHEHG